MRKVRILLILFLVPFMRELSGQTHSRAYSWSFNSGNVALNWSFENQMDFWMEESNHGLAVNGRFKASGIVNGGARSGSYVAKVSGVKSGGGDFSPLYSGGFPVRPGKAYTLSFYYQTSGTFSGTIQPKIACVSTSNMSGPVTSLAGGTFSAQSNWAFYAYSFTTPSDAQSASLQLASFATDAQATLYFDDVVLEDTALSFSQAEARRTEVTETVAFGDAFGRVHQTQAKIPGGKYLVGSVGFDEYGRVDTTYLPVPSTMSVPAYQASKLSIAQSYYNSSSPAFDAHGFPFSRVEYGEEVAPRVLASGSHDSAWQIGLRPVRQDYYFVNDTLPPSNIENPGQNPGEKKYRLDWKRNQDSTFALTWTNKLGQVVRSAVNVTSSSGSAQDWKWAATRYKYHPSGAVQKTLTPLDDSSGAETFAQVGQLNTLGLPISAYTPDRNLQKLWHNRQGQLRYSQDSVQRVSGAYSYFEYDNQGRLVSEGVHTLSAPPSQDSVDMNTYNQGLKVEHVGYIYDDTSTFQARTGFSLSEILGGWKGFLNTRYAHNRLVCKYHRNVESTVPGFTSKDKLVADFFVHDLRGQVEIILKYIGPIRDPFKRIQDCWFFYDEAGRLVSYIQYNSASETAVSSRQDYRYDHFGRVTAILGVGGKPLAGYRYTELGTMDEVILGGVPSGDSAVYVAFDYHSQGGIKKIEATSVRTGESNQRVFEQYLGYEGKAYSASGVPNLSQTNYDGSISQQVYKYTSDIHP